MPGHPVGPTLESADADLTQSEFDQILAIQKCDAIMADLDSQLLKYDRVLAFKKAVEGYRVDTAFLSAFDYNGEMESLIGQPLEIVTMESYNPELRDLYLQKAEASMEGWKEDFIRILTQLMEAFKEFMMDYIVHNRRYRFQLQKHAAMLQNSINIYCRGDQNIFAQLSVNTYHNLVWRELQAAAISVTETYSDLNQDQGDYVKKHINVLEKSFAYFGQTITADGVHSSNRGPERRVFKLGVAQWKLGDLQTYCETTIGMLKDDQTMNRAMNEVLKKMNTAKQAAQSDGDQDLARSIKKEADFFRSVLRKSSVNNGAVARALLFVCNAARDWRPPTEKDETKK